MRLLRVYARALALLGADARVAVALAIGSLVIASLQFLDPILFGRVIQLLASSNAQAPDLWPHAVGLLAVWGAVGATTIGLNVIAIVTAERLAHRHRLLAMSRFFAHALSLPLSFHGETQSGRMMKILVSGTDGLFWLWLTFFREQLANMLAVVALLPLTLLLNWRLAMALVGLVAVFMGFTALVIRFTEAGQSRAQAHQSQLIATAQDALANVAAVQSFARQDAERRRFADIVEQVIRHQFPVLNWWALVNVSTRAASTVCVITIMVVGIRLHVAGEAAIGEIVSFMGFATLLIARVDSAAGFITKLFFELPGLADYFAVLDTTTTVPQPRDAIVLPPGPGEVVFRDVGFAYPGGPTVLDELSFRARPGTATALVGQTGAGKSTAMALLQRQWDPLRGAIAIDGHDLRSLTLDSLRRSVGVVFQDSMLLNRSIRENLLIGRPNATDAELERACRLAEAHDFILRQPAGYDTMVGERGAALSGGQRQRLTIARALLKDPKILVLDEATSALDSATEARVAAALRALMAGRTTFIIAHRLSTVRDADLILVLDHGRIVERGRFDDLLASDGVFARLVGGQMAFAAVLPP